MLSAVSCTAWLASLPRRAAVVGFEIICGLAHRRPLEATRASRRPEQHCDGY